MTKNKLTTVTACLLVLAFSSILRAETPEVREVTRADVVVYGGITAAIAAAREGASVVLLEQTLHVVGKDK